MVRTRGAPWLAALLLASPGLASFSNEFAVFVPAGAAVAEALAEKHGFKYVLIPACVAAVVGRSAVGRLNSLKVGVVVSEKLCLLSRLMWPCRLYGQSAGGRNQLARIGGIEGGS